MLGHDAVVDDDDDDDDDDDEDGLCAVTAALPRCCGDVTMTGLSFIIAEPPKRSAC